MGAECVFVPITKSTKILLFESWTKYCPWKRVCLSLEDFLISPSSAGVFLGIEFSSSECLVVSFRMELNKLLSSQTTKVRFGGSGLLQGSEVQATKAHLSVHLPRQNQHQFAGMGSTPCLLVSVPASSVLCISLRVEELTYIPPVCDTSARIWSEATSKGSMCAYTCTPTCPPMHTHQGHPSL